MREGRIDVGARHQGRRDWWASFGTSAAIVLGYAVAVWFLYANLTLLDQTRLPGCGCGDVVQQVWLLEWAKVGLVHHNLSFLSTQIDYPRGANLADSASFPLLAVFAAPLTAVVGPIATLGFLFRFAIWLTATSAFATARRLGMSRPAAAVTGLVFGFSPGVMHQAQFHMFLVFLPLLPPILAIVYRQLTSGSKGSRRRGIWLGGLVVAQFLIDSEVLVGVAVVLLVVMVAVAVRRLVAIARREASWQTDLLAQARGAVTMLFVAGLVALPLLAYPIWVAVAGPQHVVGPTQSLLSMGISPAASAFPSYANVVAWHWFGLHPQGIPDQQDAGYVGLVAVAVAAVLTWQQRRVALAVGAAAMAGVAWILALGPRLVVNGRPTSIRLPFFWLQRVPGLQDLVPSRLMLIGDLAIALLLGLAVDQIACRWHIVRPRLLSATSPLTIARTAAMTVATALAVIGLLPVTQVAAADVTSLGLKGAPDLSGVVLALPYPDYRNDQAMLWQAGDGMRFSLLGGYANRPSTDGRVTKAPLIEAPAPLRQVLLSTSSRIAPALLHRARHQLAAFLRHSHVRWVVAANRGAGVVRLLVDRLGRPRRRGDFSYWAVDPREQRLAAASPGSADRVARLHAVGPDHAKRQRFVPRNMTSKLPHRRLAVRQPATDRRADGVNNRPSGGRRIPVVSRRDAPPNAVRGLHHQPTVGAGRRSSRRSSG